jgi:hypothetical protein
MAETEQDKGEREIVKEQIRTPNHTLDAGPKLPPWKDAIVVSLKKILKNIQNVRPQAPSHGQVRGTSCPPR